MERAALYSYLSGVLSAEVKRPMGTSSDFLLCKININLLYIGDSLKNCLQFECHEICKSTIPDGVHSHMLLYP